MKKLLLTFVLISSMLSAQAPVSKNIFHHGHRRLWIEVAIVAGAVGATILAEHEVRGNPKPVPQPRFITSPITGVNPSINGFFTPAQLFGDPKSPYFIRSYGEPCWMVLIEGKACGPSWVNP